MNGFEAMWDRYSFSYSMPPLRIGWELIPVSVFIKNNVVMPLSSNITEMYMRAIILCSKNTGSGTSWNPHFLNCFLASLKNNSVRIKAILYLNDAEDVNGFLPVM